MDSPIALEQKKEKAIYYFRAIGEYKPNSKIYLGLNELELSQIIGILKEARIKLDNKCIEANSTFAGYANYAICCGAFYSNVSVVTGPDNISRLSSLATAISGAPD